MTLDFLPNLLSLCGVEVSIVLIRFVFLHGSILWLSFLPTIFISDQLDIIGWLDCILVVALLGPLGQASIVLQGTPSQHSIAVRNCVVVFQKTWPVRGRGRLKVFWEQQMRRHLSFYVDQRFGQFSCGHHLWVSACSFVEIEHIANFNTWVEHWIFDLLPHSIVLFLLIKMGRIVPWNLSQLLFSDWNRLRRRWARQVDRALKPVLAD